MESSWSLTINIMALLFCIRQRKLVNCEELAENISKNQMMFDEKTRSQSYPIPRRKEYASNMLAGKIKITSKYVFDAKFYFICQK